MTQQDRRRSQRIPFPNEVKVCLPSHKAQFTCKLKDISEFGMFMESKLPLKTGEILAMQFDLPTSLAPIDLCGYIVRTEKTDESLAHNYHGFGIEFLLDNPAAIDAISSFVDTSYSLH